MSFITTDLIRRFDVAGPRYTSYPTADRFGESFGANDYAAALQARRASRSTQPLSLYVHVPFCEQLCYYCACNKIVTRRRERAAPYLDALGREVALHMPHLGAGQRVTQLHLGGGTPTFLSDDELSALMAMLRAHFTLEPGGEYSIEVDPRTVDEARLAHLARLGFNRLSFGVQDFEPTVQQAVHRVQPAERVIALVGAARRLGFGSINVDLIYGLPRQTEQTFARTLAQVAQLAPERIALYAYAHLPERFKPQRRIDAAELPSGAAKVALLAQALDALERAGYDYIGMDHFALPHDALAIAKREGRLHRNFQGYSTAPDCDLIGLGVSAIGKVGATYSQNAKALADYEAALAAGRLPVARGLTLGADDVLRRDVIMALMCQGRVRFAEVEARHGIDFARYFASELAALDELAGQGLLTLADDAAQLTPLGWFFVRGVAMVFDRHLHAAREQARYSRIV